MPGMKMNMPGMNKNTPGMDMNTSMPGMNMSMPGMKMSEAPLKDIPEDRRGKWLSSGDSRADNAISLAELEDLALKNNPTLIQAKAHIDDENGEALQAGLYRNPAASYSGDLMGLPGPGNGLGEFQGGIVEQEIILGGKLKLSREKYKARAQAAVKQAEAQKVRVLNDVRINFYRALAARERFHVQNELLKSQHDRWLTINEMLNVGEANQSDLHEANVLLEKQRLKVLEADNERQFLWQVLCTSVGVDIPFRGLSGELAGDSRPILWDQALKELLEHSPQMAEAHAKLKSDEITLQREKRQMIPDVVVAGGAGYDRLDRGFAAKATVNVVNLPLFDRNQGTILQAQADLDRQRAQIKLTELLLKRELARQYWTYTTAMQHVLSYQSLILPEAQKRYVRVLNGYRNTRAEWPAVLDAQSDFFELRLAYVSNLLKLREAETSINGFVLSGALVAPPGVNPPGHIDATPRPR
jgi:outer membrane protein, heavy metal efflux system